LSDAAIHLGYRKTARGRIDGFARLKASHPRDLSFPLSEILSFIDASSEKYR
jgi:hypothetical protein